MSRWGTDHDPVGFWTILFAVCGGVLLADLVRLAFAALAAGALLASFSKGANAGTTPGHLPARPDLIVPSPPPQQTRSSAGYVEPLYGPREAKARAVSRACIAGHAANREGGGWSQETPLVDCDALTE